MAASKSGFMKDALILFAITLVSGLCLGVVYDVTKAPIEGLYIIDPTVHGDSRGYHRSQQRNLQTGPSGGRELR